MSESTTVHHRYQVTLVDLRDGSPFESEHEQTRSAAMKHAESWLARVKAKNAARAYLFGVAVFDIMARRGAFNMWRLDDTAGRWHATGLRPAV